MGTSELIKVLTKWSKKFLSEDGTTVNTNILTTGIETPSATIVTDSSASPVIAGKVSVTFTTSSDFAGTILGVARDPATIYSFSSSLGKTLTAIAYTVTAGSMTIDVTV